MALHYYRDFALKHGSRNFGDDINPWFLSRLFRPDIIESDRICLVGIGTILNDLNAERIGHFERKVVFSTGVGYGKVTPPFDDSWDFACVRGPRSAKLLELAPEVGICDGAVLLGDLYPAKPSAAREGVVFIPHVLTGWLCGKGLRRICDDLSIDFLTPDVPFESFIERVGSARLVITEAMHGAILADTLRTPWVPISFLHHQQFKWQDWFESMALPYDCRMMRPIFWDRGRGGEKPAKAFVRGIYQRALMLRTRAKRSLRGILREATPFLSADAVLADRKRRLMERVGYINETYSG